MKKVKKVLTLLLTIWYNIGVEGEKKFLSVLDIFSMEIYNDFSDNKT